MKNKKVIMLGAICFVLIVAGGAMVYKKQSQTYTPRIVPGDFHSTVENAYFSLSPGKKMIYQKSVGADTEINEWYVTDQKRVVMGVETTVVWDRVWWNGELIEDTYDWFAQDTAGNVWYFGEASREMQGDVVVSTHGSWEAGVDGAQPGIVMKARPMVGETYHQEYYPGTAMDMADVLDIHASSTVPYGSFRDCVKTKDYTPLEPDVREEKVYCLDVGGVVLVEDADGERTELLSVVYDSQPTTELPDAMTTAVPLPRGQRVISLEEAKAIAVQKVPGVVTDVTRETVNQQHAYVVEISPQTGGAEIDVLVDMVTGAILSIED